MNTTSAPLQQIQTWIIIILRLALYPVSTIFKVNTITTCLAPKICVCHAPLDTNSGVATLFPHQYSQTWSVFTSWLVSQPCTTPAEAIGRTCVSTHTIVVNTQVPTYKPVWNVVRWFTQSAQPVSMNESPIQVAPPCTLHTMQRKHQVFDLMIVNVCCVTVFQLAPYLFLQMRGLGTHAPFCRSPMVDEVEW